MLRNTEKIREIIGFNCSPVTVTITREELLSWIGTQIAEKMLVLPKLQVLSSGRHTESKTYSPLL